MGRGSGSNSADEAKAVTRRLAQYREATADVEAGKRHLFERYVIRRYALEPDALVALSRSVFSREQVANWAPAEVDLPPAGVRNFVTADGTLTQIPASRKKRRVVLAWLADRFEADRFHTEAEVNRVLWRHHEDCATLRRELVGYRMMSRESGRYLRMPEAEWTMDWGGVMPRAECRACLPVRPSPSGIGAEPRTDVAGRGTPTSRRDRLCRGGEERHRGAFGASFRAPRGRDF